MFLISENVFIYSRQKRVLYVCEQNSDINFVKDWELIFCNIYIYDIYLPIKENTCDDKVKVCCVRRPL